jgi:hypothetical protein
MPGDLLVVHHDGWMWSAPHRMGSEVFYSFVKMGDIMLLVALHPDWLVPGLGFDRSLWMVLTSSRFGWIPESVVRAAP